MLQGTLYILAGAALYAGTQRLHADTKLRRGSADALYTILFILLALASASSATTMSPPTSNTAATLSILSGTLLWSLLPWTTVSFIRIRPGLTIDMLSAGWITVLIGQLSYPQPHDVYWSGVLWLMLLSVAYSAVIIVWHLRSTGKTVMGRYLFGLSLLALACLAGFFFGILLFPFGFLLFLLLAVHLSLPCASARLVAALAHIPARPVGMSVKPWTGTQQPAAVSPPPPGITGQRKVALSNPHHPVTESLPPGCLGNSKVTTPSRINNSERGLLMSLADELMDITVYATMALNRMQEDKANPKFLTALIRRIRSRAIKSHRDANRLARPQETEHHHDPETTD